MAANPYGALKAEDERAFAALARARGIPLAAPRIFGLSGEYINKTEIYALASLIESVRRGEPIRIRARHAVLRSYVYVGDLLALCLGLALSAVPLVEIFDTAGEASVEIGDLARLVAASLGRQDHPVLRDRDPAAPEDRYLGDPARLRALFGRAGIAPLRLRDQIVRTAAYLDAEAGR